MARLKHPFQELRWKLTFSFTVVTVAALLVVEIMLVGSIGYLIANSDLIPNALTLAVEIFIVPQIANYLDQPQPDIESLSDWLESASAEGLTFRSPDNPSLSFHLGDLDQSATIILLDENLKRLTSVPELVDPLSDEIYKLAEEALSAAKDGQKDPERVLSTSTDSSTIAIPVIGNSGAVLGIVILAITPTTAGSLGQFVSLIGVSLIIFTLAAGIIGTVFGFFTARGYTKRLSHVSQAADSWSQGDFSTFIQDRSRDEIGQLAKHLNRMAEQLQNLLQAQQELATLEERNRLARELHDSVKQQVFATSMQVGAARESLEQNPQAAQAYLAEAEQLSRQAQKELTTLIHELRPSSLQDQRLAQALKAYTTDWSRQNNIDVNLNLMDEQILSLRIEQALFRVAQEALANVARHSGGTAVNIHLVYDSQTASLSISDDGRGFDAATACGKGIGLRSMQERIAAIGGELKVKSAPGQGTQIVARCPINGEYV